MTRNPFPFLVLAIVVLLGLFGAVDAADAQPVTNPSAVLFTPSADHAQVAAYEWGTFAIGASAPIQTASVAKASLTPAGADFAFPYPRLLFGTYEHKLRACTAAPVLCSTWANADKQATTLPFPPSVVRVQ